MTNLDRYTMNVRDLAKKLGYNEQYLRRMASQGKIPALKRVRQWLFDPIEIENFLRQKTAESILK